MLTPVTTSIITSERASRRKAIAGAKSPTRTHVHSVCVNTRAVGGRLRKRAAMKNAITAAMAIEPTPTVATTDRRRRAPATTRMRKPTTGTAGTSQSRCSTSASQRRGGVGVERAEAVIELEDERKADGNLGRGHG